MGLNIGMLFDSFIDCKEEEITKFDIGNNNLITTQDFIEFFTYLGMLFKNGNMEEIQLFMDKLNYLGYFYTGVPLLNYNDIDNIKSAIIQFAFLLNLNINDEKASLCYFVCIELLKQF